MTTYIPTLTVKQAYERMSELGLRTSEEKIRAMIDQGKYPWGVSCQMKQREYEIYEVLFDLWLESVTKTVDENALFDWDYGSEAEKKVKFNEQQTHANTNHFATEDKTA